MNNTEKKRITEYIINHPQLRFSAQSLGWDYQNDHETCPDWHKISDYLIDLSHRDIIRPLNTWDNDGWMEYKLKI